jgi:aryl-alcohol dehydrogenase-like predicted oxidoreductase
LRPIAQAAGMTLSQLALRWALRQRAVTSTIVGATNPKHVDDNIAAGAMTLDAAVVAQVDRILLPVAPNEPYFA